MADSWSPLAAALADRYRIERELGAGGMATVYLAYDIRHERRVAIKVLRPELAAVLGAERFLAEIKTTANLQHPNILPLHDSGEAGGFLFYVMPFIEGESLQDRLARKGELAVPEAIRILMDVADALDYAHARGVVHRDIKPANILLSGRHAMVADFGIARAVTAATGHHQLTSTGVVLGTPAYMAPEQAAADPHLDHRVDIYALGVVGYELVSGRPPFTAPTAQAMMAAHATIPPEPVDRYRPGVPPELTSLVMRCLEKHPADRWETAGEIVSQLEGVKETAPARRKTGRIKAAGGQRRTLGWFLLGAVLVVAGAYALSRAVGLPDWTWMAAAACMVIGLPAILYTGRIEARRARARATGEYPAVGERPHHRWFTWRRLAITGVGAIGIVALLGGGYLLSRNLGIGPGATLLSSGALDSRDRLVLADFATHSADSSLGAAVTEALRVDLGQSRSVQLLDPRQIGDALKRMGVPPDTMITEPLARELALREGAKAVVGGDIARLGDGYVLTAHILTADSGAVIAPVRATASSDAELIPAVNHLSAELRSRIGESLRSIRATEPLEKVTTSSLPALRLYTSGIRAYTAGAYRSAAADLQRAIAIDTGFAMAWRSLAAAYFTLRPSLGAEANAAAHAFANRDRLPPLERSLTEASYYLSTDITHQQKAIDAYHTALQIAPNNLIATNNLGLLLIRNGRFAEAESVLRHGLVAVPAMTIADNLTDALVAQSKWAATDTLFQWADSFAPGHPTGIAIRLTTAMAHRDYHRADSIVAATAASDVGAPPGFAYGIRIRLDLLRGHYARAGEELTVLSDSLLAAGARTPAAMSAIESAELSVDIGHLAEGRKKFKAAMAGPAFRGLKQADLPIIAIGAIHALLSEPSAVAEARRIADAQGVPRLSVPEIQFGWVGFEAQAEHRWRDAAVAYSNATNQRFLKHCSPCGVFYAAQMWDAAGEADSAIAYYRLGTDRPALSYNLEDATLYPVALRRLGALYEARGDTTAALQWYGRFVDLWRDADPDLQPLVANARGELARLTAEPAAN